MSHRPEKRQRFNSPESSQNSDNSVNLMPNNNQISQLNDYIIQILNGQQDVTQTPETQRQAASSSLSNLMRELTTIIDRQNTILQNRIAEIREQEAATMAEQEASAIMEENNRMMQQIVNALARSNSRLNRTERLELNTRILDFIGQTVTNSEVQRELNNENQNILLNVRGLFNGLIQYYTEMAAYGYENGPDILARIGSILAGTAIIGSSIYAPSNSPTSGNINILMFLASYLTTTTTTATGLYFLQRGGLPVQQILSSIGTQTLSCLQTGCNTVRSEMSRMFTYGLDALGTYLTSNYENFTLNWDTNSENLSIITRSPTRAASLRSVTSSASSANDAITSIINEAVSISSEDFLEVINNPNEDAIAVDTIENGPEGSQQISEVTLSQGTMGSQDTRGSTLVGEAGTQDTVTELTALYGDIGNETFTVDEISSNDGNNNLGGKRKTKRRRIGKAKKTKKTKKQVNKTKKRKQKKSNRKAKNTKSHRK